MNTIVYFEEYPQTKVKTRLHGVSYWNGKNYMQASEPTKELILKLAADIQPDEYFILKPSVKDMVVSNNPLFIYGEKIIYLIEVNGEVVYNRYTGEHAENLKNQYLFQSKLI